MKKSPSELLESIKEKFQINSDKKFTFLLIGRTGVGKSSTINSLLGAEVAKVGDYEATTMIVEKYESEIDNIKFVVIDTPGLCDEVGHENDQKYIQLMQEKTETIDCMWFVSELHATRVTRDEKRGIQLITESLGKEIWNHAIVIFTFASYVPADRYEEALLKRTELIRNEIYKNTNNSSHLSIPSVAVDNNGKCTPDGKKWLGELFTKVFSTISVKGAIPYLLATASSIKPNEKGESRIELTKEQKIEVKKTIDAKIIPGLAATGATIGAAVGGPIGAAIGGAVGAAVGLVSWLWS